MRTYGSSNPYFPFAPPGPYFWGGLCVTLPRPRHPYWAYRRGRRRFTASDMRMRSSSSDHAAAGTRLPESLYSASGATSADSLCISRAGRPPFVITRRLVLSACACSLPSCRLIAHRQTLVAVEFDFVCFHTDHVENDELPHNDVQV